MRRRKYLKTAVAGTILGLAGCQEDGGNGDDGGNGSGSGSGSGARPQPENPDDYEQVRTLQWWSLPRSNQSDIYEYGQLAKGHWENLGLNIEWEVMENSERINKLFNHEYDVEQLKWSETPENLVPWYNMYFSFHSDNVDSGNLPEFNNEEYDSLIQEFKTNYDREAQIEAVKEAQKILAEQIPVTFLCHPNALAAANTVSFGNWKEQTGGYTYLNLNTFRDLESTGDRDTLVYGTDRTVRGFPNFMGIGASPEAWVLYKFNYDSLTEMGYTGETYGRAAEDWEIEDDTTITFTLREGMTFHDGESVTAEDVQFSWDYITEYGIPWLSSDYAAYDSSEVVDDRTITINLSEPFAPFIGVSAYRIPILPKHVWDGVVEENDLDHPRQWNNPDTTGSGPLALQEYSSNDRVIFETYDDHYWASEIPFSQFIQRIYGSQTTAVGDLENNDVQFMQSLVPTAFDRASQNDDLKAVNAPNLRTDAVFFMNTYTPFDILEFRKALAHGTQKEDIINIVYNGNAEPARTHIAPGNEEFYNPDVTYYEDDTNRAIELLREKGYRWDESGNLLKPKDLGTDEVPPPAR